MQLYLLGQSFVIKTDQQALKFLLEQRVGIEAQQQWLTKLMGYEFTIEYKKGRENRVADALSWKGDEEKEVEGLLALITFPSPKRVEELKLSYKLSPKFTKLIQKVEKNSKVLKRVKMQQGLHQKKGRLLVVPDSNFKKKVLHFIHSDPMAGHSGYLKTY